MSRFPSFFRHSPGSPPRTAARAADGTPVSIAFDRWLDAQLGERPTPGVDIESVQTLSAADRSAFASLTETFHRIDRLDTRTTGRGGSPDVRLQADIWEDIMQATLSLPSGGPSMPVVPAPSGTPVRSPIPHAGRDRRTGTGGFARLSPVLNVAMAALLVLVLGLSAWAVTGHQWGGSGEGPGGTEGTGGFASLAALDPNATPAAQGILPTADECTIQPLTIDQVMERIDPSLKIYFGANGRVPPWVPVVIVPSPHTDFDSATIIAPITTATPVSATPIDLVLPDIAAVQREMMACFVAQDPFRIWALIAPHGTYWTFLAWTLMQRMERSDVRSAIEALEAETGSERMAMLTMQGYGIINRLPLVNPDPTASAYGTDDTMTVIRVSTLAYDVNHPDRLPVVQPIDQTYQTWLYVYDEVSHRWSVDSIGDFGPLY